MENKCCAECGKFMELIPTTYGDIVMENTWCCDNCAYEEPEKEDL